MQRLTVGHWQRAGRMETHAGDSTISRLPAGTGNQGSGTTVASVPAIMSNNDFMKQDDTRIWKAGEDTALSCLRDGQRVRVVLGELSGLTGVVVGRRASGRVLIELQPGFYFEVDQYTVEGLG